MVKRTTSPRPSRSHAAAAAAVGVLLVAGLAACGSDSGDEDTAATTTTPTTTTATDATAGVAKDFSLTSVTVAPSAEVTFSNEGSATHTMTADDGAFDSDPVPGGSSAKIAAPASAGAYPFHCEIHPSMTATLTVEG